MVRDGAPRGLNAVMDKTRRGPRRPQGRCPLGMGQSMKAGGGVVLLFATMIFCLPRDRGAEERPGMTPREVFWPHCCRSTGS